MHRQVRGRAVAFEKNFMKQKWAMLTIVSNFFGGVDNSVLWLRFAQQKSYHSIPWRDSISLPIAPVSLVARGGKNAQSMTAPLHVYQKLNFADTFFYATVLNISIVLGRTNFGHF
jgi:hypothetical protein